MFTRQDAADGAGLGRLAAELVRLAAELAGAAAGLVSAAGHDAAGGAGPGGGYWAPPPADRLAAESVRGPAGVSPGPHQGRPVPAADGAETGAARERRWRARHTGGETDAAARVS